jgi:hypothetical protein
MSRACKERRERRKRKVERREREDGQRGRMRQAGRQLTDLLAETTELLRAHHRNGLLQRLGVARAHHLVQVERYSGAAH